MNDPLIYYSLTLVILLVFSGLISGSEVALFSLSKSQIQSQRNSRYIAFIKKLLSNPNKLLATILVANNFINIAIVILFTQIGSFLFESIESNVLKFISEVVDMYKLNPNSTFYGNSAINI